MKHAIMFIGMALAVFGLIFGIAFMFEGTDIALSRVFSPAREEVRRQTFEKSRAYREGMAQELQSMQLEYIQATPEQKAALASVIMHRTADVEMESLPQDLREFVIQLRAQKGMNP